MSPVVGLPPFGPLLSAFDIFSERPYFATFAFVTLAIPAVTRTAFERTLRIMCDYFNGSANSFCEPVFARSSPHPRSGIFKMLISIEQKLDPKEESRRDAQINRSRGGRPTNEMKEIGLF